MEENKNRMQWNWNEQKIREKAVDVITKSRTVYDNVGALKRDDITFNSVIKALKDNLTDYTTCAQMLSFLALVSPEKDIRGASVDVSKQFSQFEVEMGMRKDVFDVLLVATNKLTESMDPESQRFLKKLIQLGHRNGLHLAKETQIQLKDLKNKINDLCIDFNRNLSNENKELSFTAEELVGMSTDFLQQLDKDANGNYKMTLKYPHFYPCMMQARTPETRKKLEVAFNSRCIHENTPILEELVNLRHKHAQLLGFPTHAAFVLDVTMAKHPQTVTKFLDDLTNNLRELQEKDLALFLRYKKEECEKYGYHFDGQIHMWDFWYYTQMVQEREFGVDHNQLRQYFPLDVVTKGLLEIYQELLDITVAEIPYPHVWHKDVKLFQVNDNTNKELLGYFYIDFFPREGKFTHSGCERLQPSCTLQDGSRQVPVTAMLLNFTKPVDDKPVLLGHKEVVTFFHEFGHIMHDMCSKPAYSMFSGTCVERDFIETPSVMLENWCWEEEPLRRMSAHYKTGEPIPEPLLKALVGSRLACSALSRLLLATRSTFDLLIHTREQADTAAIFAEVCQGILGIPATPGTNFPAGYMHMTSNYDSRYYGYLWSEVYSKEMFYSRFKKEGINNPTVGSHYRKCILQPGGALDGETMLRDFLGRLPTQDAFYQSLGLQIPTSGNQDAKT